jgi:hypothetical protein
MPETISFPSFSDGSIASTSRLQRESLDKVYLAYTFVNNFFDVFSGRHVCPEFGHFRASPNVLRSFLRSAIAHGEQEDRKKEKAR